MSATRSALLAAVAALLTPDGSGNILLGSTPAQFDNSTKLVDSAFVQRALGNMNGFTNLVVSTTLTAANIGGYLAVGTVSGLTHTLPNPALCVGGKITVYNYAAYSTTFAAYSGSHINVGPIVGTLTSAIVSPGDNAEFYSDGSNWSLLGSMQLTQSPLFAKSLAANGYQKLPSGLIIQWGSAAASAGTAGVFINTAVTWPIAFPTAILGSMASLNGGNYAAGYTNLSIESSTTTGATLIYTCAISQTSAYKYLAIGY